jgi:hypothetical protein
MNRAARICSVAKSGQVRLTMGQLLTSAQQHAVHNFQAMPGCLGATNALGQELQHACHGQRSSCL